MPWTCMLEQVCTRPYSSPSLVILMSSIWHKSGQRPWFFAQILYTAAPLASDASTGLSSNWVSEGRWHMSSRVPRRHRRIGKWQ